MSLDFEVFWLSGPWEKKGKTDARKRFTRTVKTQEDERLIQLARDEFAAYCRDNATWYRPRWGSTFMSSWRDWLTREKTTATPLSDSFAHNTEHECVLCNDPHVWTCTDQLCTLEKRAPCAGWMSAYLARMKRA
jgi:hypothetical protein